MWAFKTITARVNSQPIKRAHCGIDKYNGGRWCMVASKQTLERDILGRTVFSVLLALLVQVRVDLVRYLDKERQILAGKT